jgi:flagellar basal body-associated protein FliL
MKKRKKTILIVIIIIVIAVVAVAAIGAGVFIFVLGDPAEPPEVRVEHSPGDHFTVNVKDAQVGRILRTGIVLIVNEEGLEDMLSEANNRIRDTIIFILRDLNEEDISAPGTQDLLRQRIITALNERLGIDNFVEVLFNDFVMA